VTSLKIDQYDFRVVPYLNLLSTPSSHNITYLTSSKDKDIDKYMSDVYTRPHVKIMFTGNFNTGKTHLMSKFTGRNPPKGLA
jgi:hypothetical protein